MSHDYKYISNEPKRRQFGIPNLISVNDTFSVDQLDAIERMCASNVLDKATTMGQDDTQQSCIRRSACKFYTVNQETQWIFARLNEVVEHVNNSLFNFDLNGYEAFQYTEYRLNGEYNFHQDSSEFWNPSMGESETRKLSMSVVLNTPGVDFEGGEFETRTGHEDTKHESARGRIFVFPSYVVHRVTPVTRGVRKSLVVWVTGPKFR
jgi:PKHD-type hydroxylase